MLNCLSSCIKKFTSFVSPFHFAIINYYLCGVIFILKTLVFIFLLLSSVHADSSDNIADVCSQLKLIPASKAIVQWERVFSSDARKKRYHIDQLSPEVQLLLKAYLIDHAADSSQPMVPGL